MQNIPHLQLSQLPSAIQMCENRLIDTSRWNRDFKNGRYLTIVWKVRSAAAYSNKLKILVNNGAILKESNKAAHGVLHNANVKYKSQYKYFSEFSQNLSKIFQCICYIVIIHCMLQNCFNAYEYVVSKCQLFSGFCYKRSAFIDYIHDLFLTRCTFSHR
jgi:hypothetical protein